MQHIIITGGAGFVGSQVALACKQAYPQAGVRALDNLKRRGSELALPRLRAAGVEFVHADIRQPEDLTAITQCDLLIECSAEPSVLAGLDGHTVYCVQTNLVGTVHCLELVRRTRAAMIFLSTSRVYPYRRLANVPYVTTPTRLTWDATQLPVGITARGVTEDFSLEGPRSLYGATKLASELLIAEYADSFGVRAVINRCGVIAGPWQMGKVDQGVVALWVAQHLWGDTLRYIGFGGAGQQVRDIVAIDDVCALVLEQMGAIETHAGATYNVGGGWDRSISLCELTALCQQATGRSVPVGSDPQTRPVDIPIYVTDNSRVEAAMRWRPQTSVAALVAQVTAWMRTHEAQLRPIFCP